jgi:hypothetical protein
MPVSRLLSAGLLLGAIGLPAVAADASHNETCLTRAQQRAAVNASRAISLAQGIKLLRQSRKHSEVVRARFSRRKLVYVLTRWARQRSRQPLMPSAASFMPAREWRIMPCASS